MDRNLYYLWMRVDNKVTNAKIVKLLEYFGAPEEIYKADANALKSCKFLAEREIKALLDKDLGVAESEADMCELCHVGLLSIDDADYPEMLRNIPEYPVLLYTMGDTSLLNTLCVTMVGARKATPYGLSVGMTISQELAAAGFTIVSGFAVGGDSACHKGALNVGGKTVAVLGAGIDVDYPSENKGLRQKLLAGGGLLVSEFPLGTPAYGKNFPFRNRVLSGLSFATIVVEGDKNSGALITAKYAAEQNRDVFAVPGNITSSLSRGTNLLIQDGAVPILSSADVGGDFYERYAPLLAQKADKKEEGDPLDALEPFSEPNWDAAPATPEEKFKEKPEIPMADEVLAALSGGPLTLDEIAALSGLEVKEAASRLVLLELRGSVEKNGPNSYQLKKRQK